MENLALKTFFLKVLTDKSLSITERWLSNYVGLTSYFAEDFWHIISQYRTFETQFGWQQINEISAMCNGSKITYRLSIHIDDVVFIEY